MRPISELIPAAVATANSALAKREIAPPATTEGVDFARALQETRLHKLPEENLKQALRYIYLIVGLKAESYPTGLEKDVLHAYVIKHYGGHTAAELRLAFEMALQQKLGMRPDDVRCYNNFSIAYFTEIMEAYRAWAKEQVKLLPPPAFEKPDPTPDQLRNIDLDFLHYQLTLVNKLPYLLKLHL